MLEAAPGSLHGMVRVSLQNFSKQLALSGGVEGGNKGILQHRGGRITLVVVLDKAPLDEPGACRL